MGLDETGAPEKAAILDMLAALATPQVENVDTPGDFLATLSASLKALEGVDVDIAGILSDHLLTVAPDPNAVSNAKAAIVAIAAKRAALGQEEVDG